MLRIISDDGFRSALVTGCVGSGKTTLTVYRLLRLSRQGQRAHLLTFHKMLVRAIGCTPDVRRDSPASVSNVHQWFWDLTGTMLGNLDCNPLPAKEIKRRLGARRAAGPPLKEILIDEGQDLPPSLYEALPQAFEGTRILVTADDAQRVYPRRACERAIEEALRKDAAPFRRFAMGWNFRNSYEIFAFARQFIPKTNQVVWDPATLARLDRPNRHGPKPVVVSYLDDGWRNDHLRRVLRNAEGNVGILCPLALERGYRSGLAVDEVHALVEKKGIRATKYHYKTEVPAKLEPYLVTTIKSAKGIEFDVVVIPRINCGPVKEDSAEDDSKTRQRLASMRNQWFVACTRAKHRLIVYRDLRPDPRGEEVDPIEEFEFAADTYEAETQPDLSERAARSTKEVPF